MGTNAAFSSTEYNANSNTDWSKQLIYLTPQLTDSSQYSPLIDWNHAKCNSSDMNFSTFK